VPVTVTEGTAVARTGSRADDVAPSDEAPEQALSAGTASATAATAVTGTSVRNGATVPPRLG
jgi:hypothetical protein